MSVHWTSPCAGDQTIPSPRALPALTAISAWPVMRPPLLAAKRGMKLRRRRFKHNFSLRISMRRRAARAWIILQIRRAPSWRCILPSLSLADFPGRAAPSKDGRRPAGDELTMLRSMLLAAILLGASTAAYADMGTPEQRAACAPDVRK